MELDRRVDEKKTKLRKREVKREGKRGEWETQREKKFGT